MENYSNRVMFMINTNRKHQRVMQKEIAEAWISEGVTSTPNLITSLPVISFKETVGLFY